MAQKTYKQIEAEANQKFGKKPSKEKFEYRRAQQREAGLDTEGKKRGGVAGAYDRNKGLVKAVATGAAGLLGGPGAAALLGGAIGGLDREGKSGIGLDLGGAAKGALSGAAMGGVGAGMGGAIKGATSAAGQGMGALLTGAKQGAMQGMRSYTGSIPGMGGGAPAGGTTGGVAGGATGGAGTIPLDQVANANVTGGVGRMGRMLGGLKEYAPVIQAGTTAVADVLGQRSQQQIEEQRLAQQQGQFQKTFDVGEEERRRQREQQNRLAGLFMPRSA